MGHNIGIKCGICGDGSHPTRDCPFQNKDQTSDDVTLNKEYFDFMSELGVDETTLGGNGPLKQLKSSTSNNISGMMEIVAPSMNNTTSSLSNPSMVPSSIFEKNFFIFFSSVFLKQT